jgi:hypothetical protein
LICDATSSLRAYFVLGNMRRTMEFERFFAT